MAGAASKQDASERRVTGPGRLGYATFFGLYLAQGVVFGFGGYVLIPRLSAAAVPLSQQAMLLSLAGLPWVFKLAWGPLVDRLGRASTGVPQRVAASALGAVACAVLGLAMVTDPAQSVALASWLWLSLNLALSLQDVATDAIVLDAVSPGHRGRANGVMLLGHHLGAEALGAMVLGVVVASAGMSIALVTMAAIMVLVAALVLIEVRVSAGLVHGQPDPVRQPVAGCNRGFRAQLRPVIAAPRTWIIGCVAATVLLADVVTSAVSAHFWVQTLRVDPVWITGRLAPTVLIGSAAGYVLCSVVVDRVGHARTFAWASFGLGAVWIAFALAERLWLSRSFLLGFAGIQAIITAHVYAALHAALMGEVDPRVRATHYAWLTALLNLPRAYGPLLGAALVVPLGWPGLFAACGAYQVAWAVVGWGWWRATPGAGTRT